MTIVGKPTPDSEKNVATGIEGLDNILEGGLTPGRLYLLEGLPGSGKTTLALQFLMEGVRHGERVLYLTLSETVEELTQVARSHGWSLEGIGFRELVPTEQNIQPEKQYTMFHPAEVELSATTKVIFSSVEEIKPARVVLDSLSELRLLAGTPLRYRREILALKQFFAGRDCTVLMLDDVSFKDDDLQVQSIAHAVVQLEQMSPEYGAERRRLRVLKFRGKHFRGGFHDFVIRRGGLDVFPRLIAAEHRVVIPISRLPSGVPALDRLLGGGLERGTSTLITGGAGTGKSSLAAQFLVSAAAQGLRSTFFIFDESTNTLVTRCTAMGMGLQEYIDKGVITVQQVDPAELSPGEFADKIRRSVVLNGVAVVVVDSLNGYLNAMPEERFLVIQFHELLTYLGQKGVATLMIGAHAGLVGGPMVSPVDASYLADTVLLLRYFELHGEVRQAISVIKKRGGAHERTIRELTLSSEGIRVGEPLRDFRGILTGVPQWDTEPRHTKEPRHGS